MNDLTGDPSHAPRRAAGARVAAVDFSRPSKFTKEQERQLRRAHETFCRTASTGLSADIRAQIDLEVIGVTQLSWSNAVLEIGQDSVCAVVDVAPLGTQLVLTFERVFLLTLIDRLCGSGLSQVPPDRRLSDIDLVMARRIVTLFLDQLTVVWHELAGVELGFAGLELEPAGAQIAAFSDPTLVLTIEARLSRASFGLAVLLPYSAIEQATGRFTAGPSDGPARDDGASASMRQAMRGVEVELRAELAAAELSAEEVLSLKAGDLVRFGSAASGVTLYADHVPIHRARPGRDGNQRAVQITSGRQG